MNITVGCSNRRAGLVSTKWLSSCFPPQFSILGGNLYSKMEGAARKTNYSDLPSSSQILSTQHGLSFGPDIAHSLPSNSITSPLVVGQSITSPVCCFPESYETLAHATTCSSQNILSDEGREFVRQQFQYQTFLQKALCHCGKRAVLRSTLTSPA